MSKIKIQGNASGTGIFTVAAPATNTDRTITLPDTSSTLLAPDSTGSIQLDFAGSNNYLKFISSSNYVGRNASTGDIWLNAQGGQSVILGINGTSQLKVDGNGRVTIPNQPKFFAYGPNGGGSTNAVQVFDTAVVNNGGYYSTSTGRFTAPIAGQYFFITNLLSDQNVPFNYGIRKNGVVQVRGENTATTQWRQATTSCILDLAAGDYVDAYITGGSTNGGQYDSFCGYLIG